MATCDGATMRGIRCDGKGGTDVMKFVDDLPRPQLDADSAYVLIQVKATSVNRLDTLQRKGMAPVPPGASEILGVEAAGVISGTGSKATKWKVGDRVMCLLAGGGYGEYLTVHESSCLAIPENLSFAEAAGVCEVFLTAFQSMRLNADVKAGDTVLVHAGASGVGTAACQLCKVFGVTSVTTSSEGKVKECQQFADHAVSRTPDEESKSIFSSKVVAAIGANKVNLVIDPVWGGGYAQEDAEVLAMDGKIVVLAFMGGNTIPEFNATPFFRKRAEIKFSTLRSQSTEYKGRLVSQFAEEALPHFATGKLKPVISKVLPIQQAAAAHDEVESNSTVGKIILTFE